MREMNEKLNLHLYSFQDTLTPNHCPDTVLRSLNERLSKSQTSESSVNGSLDLLRLNLQLSFDKEIDAIVSKYREKFFLKAVQNLKRNLGEHAVTENDVRRG